MGYSEVMSTPASHSHHAQSGNTSHPKEDIPEIYTTNDDEFIDHDVKTYLTWDAPGRPFKEHSKEYFINGFLIMIAVEIIIYIVFKELVLMLVVFSFVFLSYALALVPPRKFFYKLTSEGIRVEDHFYIWDELYDFYFMKHYDEETLHIRTKAFFPGELTITLGDVPVNQVKKIMIMFLPYREYVKPTFLEESGDWLQRNFPLEKQKS